MNKFSPIENIIKDVKKGIPLIIVDDEDRENEGDFVVASEKITPEIINFMAKEGRGLICEGDNLGKPGYESITIQYNDAGVPVVYGSAWVDVNKDNLDDWKNPDGSWKL